ncbi:MAG: hypothetical protein R3D26_12045 [Cyanobacteriota/Melainabacteria group bacterium]
MKKAGINVVYFDTNNAGFTMYPSKLTEQNPRDKRMEPLAVAVQEARKHGMEILTPGSDIQWATCATTRSSARSRLSWSVLNRYDFNWAMASNRFFSAALFQSGVLDRSEQHRLSPLCQKLDS